MKSTEEKSAKRKTKYGDNSTSFVPLLRHFTGMKNVTIELKTGRTYHGELVEVDHFMNITLHCQSKKKNNQQKQRQIESTSSSSEKNSTIFTTNEMEEEEEDEVIIRGPKIRYVFFPNNVNLNGMIRDGVDREKSAENKYQRGIRK